MKPFCGYNFGDYWAHWLSFAAASDRLPKIFHVNWFRKDSDGRFMWPGFGQNMRVLEWIVRRCRGEAEAASTPVGRVPHAEDLNLKGISVPPETMEALLHIDVGAWREELASIGQYLHSYGDRTPPALRVEQQRVLRALNDS